MRIEDGGSTAQKLGSVCLGSEDFGFLHHSTIEAYAADYQHVSVREHRGGVPRAPSLKLHARFSDHDFTNRAGRFKSADLEQPAIREQRRGLARKTILRARRLRRAL